MTNRREFIRVAATTAGALGLGLAGSANTADARQQQVRTSGSSTGAAPRKIKLLILGGTGFIGPFQVKYALERGHEVTIFNRGQSAPGMFKGVEELIGDRAANNYSALKGRTWDAVIDNSASGGRAPTWVKEAGAVLRDSVGQFLFISTRSVYRDLSMVPATIDAPLMQKSTAQAQSEADNSGDYAYGLAKALAEGEAKTVFGNRLTVVRPGLIVGPEDDTDRFTYWPVRIARGGEILCPGTGEDRVQVIDVRDLCEWAVRLCEQKTFGTYMGVGPLNGRSMAEMLHGIAAVINTPLSWTWVPTDFLSQNRVRAYQEMPVWRPASPGFEGFARFDLTREVASGLTFRTLADTALATLEFFRSKPAAQQKIAPGVGLTAEREAEVLKLWHARHGM